MIEEWVSCTLSEFHEVSNLGRVRRIPHIREDVLGRKHRMKRTILKGSEDVYGYMKVKLKCKDGIRSLFIHRLVALAFIPNPDNKKVVNHLDGDKLNNRVDNLKWATHKENSRHAWKMGLCTPSRGNTKLTESEVKKILNSSESVDDLAIKFKVSVSAIKAILSGRNWSHL